jgi:4-hydroxy-tetrahydrodipicolinate synthase
MLADAVYAGVDGGVCGGANMFPSLYVRLFAAARQGNIEQARQLQETVQVVSQNVYQPLGGASSYLRGLKCALAALGLCSPTVADPLAPIEGSGVDAIQKFVLSVPGLSNNHPTSLAASTPMR